MNENDDVMTFNDEPESIPQNYEEPDISNIPGASNNENEETSEQNEELYKGYENFEAMDFNDFSGENEIKSSDSNESAKSDFSSDNNNSENYNEESQAKQILETKPSEKSTDKANKNKGLFLNRQRILLIFAGIFVAFILFFTFVFPELSNKQKKNEEKELEKNGKNYIPQFITSPESEIPKSSQFENGNSAIDSKNEYITEEAASMEEKYPEIIKENEHKAPVTVTSGTSPASEVPLTNRNEQQKQPQRLSLDKVTSPVEAENKKGGKYPTVGPKGYNTGYNSGYTGTDTNPAAGGYTPQNLSNNLDRYLAQQTGGNLASSYVQQNNQSAKQEFLNKNGIGGQFQWNDEFSLWKGTIISAVLDTGINTNLPGQVMAHVTKNIYSSQDAKYLLIPQGSRLFGEYSSNISYGQSRIQVVWNTLIRPDGLEIHLGSMNGIDPYGFSGYKGWKSEHPFEYLKAFGLIAMYSVLDTKAMNTINTQNNQYAQNALSDVYSETRKLNNKIIDRALDIQPTLTIDSGTEINLITNVTIDIPPLEPYQPEEKYIRY